MSCSEDNSLVFMLIISMNPGSSKVVSSWVFDEDNWGREESFFERMSSSFEIATGVGLKCEYFRAIKGESEQFLYKAFPLTISQT